MKTKDKEVIGYFAYNSGTLYSVCDGDACVIAGSAKALNGYVSKLSKGKITDYRVKKTKYGEIVKGLQLGGAYTFDKRAYRRFYSIAKEDGLNVFEFKLNTTPKPDENAVPLMRVQLTDSR